MTESVLHKEADVIFTVSKMSSSYMRQLIPITVGLLRQSDVMSEIYN